MTPTQEQSAAALEHVRYEIEALLQEPVHNKLDETIVETIYFRKMAHSRALSEFFTKTIRRNDDVLAADYGFPVRPLYDDANAQKFLDRYNKCLLHISYTRIKLAGSDKHWPLPEMLSPVKKRCQEFIPHVIALSWPSIAEDERNKWRSLIPNYLASVPLQQNTSNVATH